MRGSVTCSYIPAVAGGIFGLIGGYLTDLSRPPPRARVEHPLYAFSAFAAGSSTVGRMAAVLALLHVRRRVRRVRGRRRLAGGAFPDPQAARDASSATRRRSDRIGGVHGHRGLLSGRHLRSTSLPAIRGGHEAWRYTLMSGVIPAIPLIIIRPFLPESPAWQREEGAPARSKRPSFAELVRRRSFRTTTIVTTMMMACAYAAAFGAIQQMPRIVPGLARGARRSRVRRSSRSSSAVQSFQEFGGPRRADPARVSRRAHPEPPPAAAHLPGAGPASCCRSSFCVRGDEQLCRSLRWGIFVVGLTDHRAVQLLGQLSAARLSRRTSRGTGESFAANVGGRMIGTSPRSSRRSS